MMKFTQELNPSGGLNFTIKERMKRAESVCASNDDDETRMMINTEVWIQILILLWSLKLVFIRELCMLIVLIYGILWKWEGGNDDARDKSERLFVLSPSASWRQSVA